MAVESRATRECDASPEIAARSVGLIYVNDAQPGISRETRGGTVSYRDPEGRIVRDRKTLDRIAALVIPPAWTDVWICPSPRGHLQATGRDERGRKQYRYHVRWRETRDDAKYERLAAFAEALAVIREQVEKDLAKPGLPREKVVATVVRLLETTLIRVGNQEYARTNKTFGLTTMCDRHVEVDGSEIRFHFRGKSGQEHEVDVKDRRLANIVKRCRELPGQDLFQYVNGDGTRHTVGSADVNDYLREITGEDYTAKDFRTWAGTVLGALELHGREEAETEAQRKLQVVRAVDAVAKHLGNTRAVCRKCYIHPAVIDAYLAGGLNRRMRIRATKAGDAGASLSPEEAAVLAFLRRQSEEAAAA
jgi:DNA topoisomerase-1